MKNKQKSEGSLRIFKKQISLQIFVLLGIFYIIVFNYIPMFGIVIGFKDYDIVTGVKGMFTSSWVGFKYFIEFYNDYNFWSLVKNTVSISLLKIIFSFPLPIIFAIMINEIKHVRFKKLVQTSSYLPHFISWVIISGISFQFFSSGGIVNTLLEKLNLIETPIAFLSDPNLFWGFAVATDVWKEMGWWTIIFLAAIVGVGQDLYEAAQIDGASRMKRIWYITLPCIMPTIIVVLILALGNLFGGGLSGSNFEQSYLFGNSMNQEKSAIIQTYVFKVGLSQGRYAYATAVGLIQSLISLVLVLSSNFVSKKMTGNGLY